MSIFKATPVRSLSKLPFRRSSEGCAALLLLCLVLLATDPCGAQPITIDSQSRTITAVVDTDSDTDTSILDGLYSNTVTAFSAPTTMTSIQATTLTIDAPGDLLTFVGSGSSNGVRPSNPGDPGSLDGSLSSATFTFTLTETVMWSLDFDYTIDDNSNQVDPAVSYSLTGTTSGSFTTDGANLQSYANVTLSTTLNEDDVQVLAGADSICLLQASESGKIFAVWEGKTEGTVYGQFADAAAAPTTCADDGSAPAWSGW